MGTAPSGACRRCPSVAAGVDGVSLARFEQDLKGNLYKVWNRIHAVSKFSLPVFRPLAGSGGVGTRPRLPRGTAVRCRRCTRTRLPSTLAPLCIWRPSGRIAHRSQSAASVPSRPICIGWSTGLPNAVSRPWSWKSTSVYWIPIFQLLDARGFTVFLVNARDAKHVPGRKTDVSDAQWPQSSHLPSACSNGRGCSAPASAGDRAVAAQSGLASLYAVSWDHRRFINAGGQHPQPVGPWASVSESDDGTRLSLSASPRSRRISTECHGESLPGGRYSPLVVSVAPALPTGARSGSKQQVDRLARGAGPACAGKQLHARGLRSVIAAQRSRAAPVPQSQ